MNLALGAKETSVVVRARRSDQDRVQKDVNNVLDAGVVYHIFVWRDGTSIGRSNLRRDRFTCFFLSCHLVHPRHDQVTCCRRRWRTEGTYLSSFRRGSPARQMGISLRLWLHHPLHPASRQGRGAGFAHGVRVLPRFCACLATNSTLRV